MQWLVVPSRKDKSYYWPNGYPEMEFHSDFPDNDNVIGTFLDYTDSIRIKSEDDNNLNLAAVRPPTEKQIDTILKRVRKAGIPVVNLDIQDNEGNIKNSVTYDTFMLSAVGRALRGVK